jgi:hypothetical protein
MLTCSPYYDDKLKRYVVYEVHTYPNMRIDIYGCPLRVIDRPVKLSIEIYFPRNNTIDNDDENHFNLDEFHSLTDTGESESTLKEIMERGAQEPERDFNDPRYVILQDENGGDHHFINGIRYETKFWDETSKNMDHTNNILYHMTFDQLMRFYPNCEDLSFSGNKYMELDFSMLVPYHRVKKLNLQCKMNNLYGIEFFMNLEKLYMHYCKSQNPFNLSNLNGLPIKQLWLLGTAIDLSTSLDLPLLKSITINDKIEQETSGHFEMLISSVNRLPLLSEIEIYVYNEKDYCIQEQKYDDSEEQEYDDSEEQKDDDDEEQKDGDNKEQKDDDDEEQEYDDNEEYEYRISPYVQELENRLRAAYPSAIIRSRYD